MMTPIDINVGALIRKREAARASQAPSAISTEADLAAIVSDILSKLPAGKQSVMITNQGMAAPNDGYFIMTLQAKKIGLTSHKTFQKISHDYDLDSHKLLLNDNPVDKSFIAPFLNKMDMLMALVKTNKAKVVAS